MTSSWPVPLVMSHLVAIYIKTYQNKLSPCAAASTAAMGAGPPSPGCWGPVRADQPLHQQHDWGCFGIICDGAGSPAP